MSHQQSFSYVGTVFLGWTSTKLGLMCLAQGHNPVTPVRLEPAAPRSRVKYSTTEPLRSPVICILSLTSISEQSRRHLSWIVGETPFNALANKADPDQAALVRAAWSGSTLFAYGNMIYLILTRNFFVLNTNMKVYLYKYSKWVEPSMNIHEGKRLNVNAILTRCVIVILELLVSCWPCLDQ